jgi:hypothetical protein
MCTRTPENCERASGVRVSFAARQGGPAAAMPAPAGPARPTGATTTSSIPHALLVTAAAVCRRGAGPVG